MSLRTLVQIPLYPSGSPSPLANFFVRIYLPLACHTAFGMSLHLRPFGANVTRIVYLPSRRHQAIFYASAEWCTRHLHRL